MIKLGEFKATKRQKRIVNDIMNSGYITEGKYVKLVEQEIKQFLKCKDAIAVTNGTVALQLVAERIRNKYGSKLTVCVPALTFPATINAFKHLGFKVVLCDIRPDTLCIDIDTLSRKQKKKIDIMVPVHLMGYTADMDNIMEQSKKYNWIVIEDFAEAFGSIYKGKKVGTIGHFGCSSFYMSHIIQGGELGVVTTNNKVDAAIMRKIKNHGRSGDPLVFNHIYVGSNYKTTEFCAGICYAQMKYADKVIKKRQDNAKYMRNNIKNPHMIPFPVNKNNSLLGYTFQCLSKFYRNYICEELNDNGIETRYMFPCLANQKSYKDEYNTDDYPIANHVERTHFYLGCHQHMTKSDLKKIVSVLNGTKK